MKSRFTDSAPVMIQRMRVRFSREGAAAQLTHLKQIDAIRRAFKDAHWPIKKISFGPAVSVGVESQAELCDVQLSARLDQTKGREELDAHLPKGYRVMEVKSIPRFFPSLEESINLCHVHMASPLLEGSRAHWDRFWAAAEFIVIKKKSDREVVMDARPLIKSWTLDGSQLDLFLRFGPGRTLKPERIVQAVCGLPEADCQVGMPECQLSVKRMQFYFEKDNGELIQI